MANEDKEVLVPQQAEVEVYLNTKGDIVFKRETDEYERQTGTKSEDLVIVIPRAYLGQLIARLQAFQSEVEDED